MVPIPDSRPLQGRIDPLAPGWDPGDFVCGVQHPYLVEKQPRGSINASSLECYSLSMFSQALGTVYNIQPALCIES